MSLFGCESIYQPVTHTWKQTKAAAWSESEQGPGAGTLRFPPQLMLGFLACVSFLPPVNWGWQVRVGVFGKPRECLENAVRAAPALGQQSENPSAETLGHRLQLLKLESQN